MPEGYVVVDQFSHVRQTRETVELLLQAVRDITEVPACVLVLMNGQPTDKEARARIASATEMHVVAMVLTSAVGTVLVNFFLRVNKPRFPMKVFRDEASAREWLVTQCRSKGAALAEAESDADGVT